MNVSTGTTGSTMARGELKPLRQERISPVSGTLGWQSLPPGWRRLCGSVPEVGVGIEWHDFHLSARFDWSRAFHPGSLELCLNLAGQGVVRCGGSALAFEPATAGFYLPGSGIVLSPSSSLPGFSAAICRRAMALCIRWLKVLFGVARVGLVWA